MMLGCMQERILAMLTALSMPHRSKRLTSPVSPKIPSR